ncbi:hypothetical protein [Leptothoe spongobia]|uniref:Uncharacterized protein n=1 Tax=Leptothoe spongobia TAU-MAC 1115 TaxID=1967444 RepID=A0A947DGX1_9CYAN|nr:hypothetical protein [Leptothoe spongobia]MBT9316169.1 hypothetical protein [Leptothoe spongobia TAU-MAC 1115]
MFPNTASHTIKYRISCQQSARKATRVTLRETAPRNHNRLKPYLYAANYTVKSIDEAYQLLREYLYTNGVTAVEDLDFPTRGKIEVVPGAAWSGFQANIKADGDATDKDADRSNRLAS